MVGRFPAGRLALRMTTIRKTLLSVSLVAATLTNSVQGQDQKLATLLERNGTAAPEVLTWEAKVDGNRLSFQGPISEASLTGLLNIVSLLGAAENVSDKLITVSDSPGSETERIAESLSGNYH